MSIGWFIDGVPPGAGRVDRRRVLVQGSFVGAVVSAFFVVQRSWLVPGFGLHNASIAAICLLLLVIPFVLKATRNYTLAAHLMVAGLSLAIIQDSALFGSIGEPTTIAYLITPLMAAFFLGRRATAGYGLMMAAGAVVVTILEIKGLLPPRLVMPPVSWLGTVTGLIFFLVVVMRIYDRERDDEARKTQAIVDNLSDGLAGLSAAGIVERSNAPFVDLLQLSRDPVGAPFEALGAPWAGSIRSAIEKGEAVTTTHEVAERVVTVTTSPYKGGAVVLVRDVTRETEVDRMKTEFTSIVSHELRTPLAAILGFAKIIRKRLETRILPQFQTDDARTQQAIETVTQNLGTIVSEGERLGRLIDDMLDIAKMEAGQMRWERGPVDVAALLRGATDTTRALFGPSVQLVVEVPEGLPTIVGDQTRLHQLLLNFISNAAKFTPSGQVTVAAAAVDGYVELSVADTGPGIPADELPNVFDKFLQVRGTRIAGTGLGLAICREIATAHGGTVHVESTVGEGSRFAARFPVG